MIRTLLFNDLLSLSAQTAILEACDWDESIASRISHIINSTDISPDIEEAKNMLRFNLIENDIPQNAIDAIFILIEIEEAKIQARPRL